MKFLARIKYRFDIGQSFLAVCNFAFVVIAASDKISSVTQLPARVLVPILVPAAIVLVWLAGYILDRFRFMDAYQHEMNVRNGMLKEIRRGTINHRDAMSTEGTCTHDE